MTAVHLTTVNEGIVDGLLGGHMERDFRASEEYREAQALVEQMLHPGTGRIVDAAQLDVAANGSVAVFAGTIVDVLDDVASTRICRADLATGASEVLTFGPNTDHYPMFAPDGRSVAFLSDRHKKGDFQLFILDLEIGAARAAPRVGGWIESLQWSADGRSILLGVAESGADVSGAQGAIKSTSFEGQLPSWMPDVEDGEESRRWRSAWCFDLGENRVWQVTAPNMNIWEAAWSGPDAIVAVTTPDPTEGAWYAASLCLVELSTGVSSVLYAPHDQIGWPASSPDGDRVSVVEAVCSDRGVVLGNLLVIDVPSKRAQQVDTHGIDVTYAEWRSSNVLLIVGVRGLHTVVARYDVVRDELTELWDSLEITSAGYCPRVCGLNEEGDCVLIGEGFSTAPEIAIIRKGRYQTVRSFDAGYADLLGFAAEPEIVNWRAPDGLELEGWLMRPKLRQPPYPLILNVHGGPIAHLRSTFLGRGRPSTWMLLKRGYAIFKPNPRGSSGRGQDFARRVVGDMGGADTQDLLSGLDHLVASGIADPDRLGVMGVSYGGFMSAWLITQDARFAAAVVISPMSNFVSQRLISNIPHFMKMFVDGDFTDPEGQYFTRSPIMHAHKAKTPTLNVCGALDRCTPPEESVQFHNALLENGVKSVLVSYPQDGHGIRKYPATIDFTARLVRWFDQHLRDAVSAEDRDGGGCA